LTLDELIIQCKKQDAKAQGELYKRYSGILFSICLRYSPNYTEAEDSLQDSFLTIFKKVDQFKGKGSFEGWIKRITVNTVLQKYRKKRVFEIAREDQIADEIDVDLEVEDDGIPLDFLLKIIQELPDRYRLVFTLYVMDDYAHKEIADMLGISDGTSKSNLARGRMILKTKIENYKSANRAP
jgi:RNA polymerase sigma-70 factor (ECF subfamily)